MNHCVCVYYRNVKFRSHGVVRTDGNQTRLSIT